jgi:hypothetical protein
VPRRAPAADGGFLIPDDIDEGPRPVPGAFMSIAAGVFSMAGRVAWAAPSCRAPGEWSRAACWRSRRSVPPAAAGAGAPRSERLATVPRRPLPFRFARSLAPLREHGFASSRRPVGIGPPGGWINGNRGGPFTQIHVSFATLNLNLWMGAARRPARNPRCDPCHQCKYLSPFITMDYGSIGAGYWIMQQPQGTSTHRKPYGGPCKVRGTRNPEG